MLVSVQEIQSRFKGPELSRVLLEKKVDFFFFFSEEKVAASALMYLREPVVLGQSQIISHPTNHKSSFLC